MTDESAPSEPGVYPNVPIEQYHAGPGYSSSEIKYILKESPFAFRHKYILEELAKDLTKWGDTNRPLCIGGATAALMDGEDVFAVGYVVLDMEKEYQHKNQMLRAKDATTKNANAFKIPWRETVLANTDKTVILPNERDQAAAIIEAIHSHPDPWTRDQLDGLFSSKELRAECSYYHKDEQTGLLVKTRPDLGIAGSLLVDIKTTSDCGEWGFSKRILDQDHHIQAAMGIDIVNRAEQCAIENWMLIVVEQNPPHDVAVWYLGKPTLALGYRKFRSGLMRIAGCLKHGKWPGKVSGLREINVPVYALNEQPDDIRSIDTADSQTGVMR